MHRALGCPENRCGRSSKVSVRLEGKGGVGLEKRVEEEKEVGEWEAGAWDPEDWPQRLQRSGPHRRSQTHNPQV